MPWDVREYPSLTGGLAELCGVSVRTAKRWLATDQVPARHALKIASLCEEHGLRQLAAAKNLREMVERRQAEKKARGKKRGG